MLRVTLGPHPDQSCQGDEMKQGDVGIKTLLNISPVKLHAPGTNPEENQSGQDQLCEPPAKPSYKDLHSSLARHSGHDQVDANLGGNKFYFQFGTEKL